MNSWKERLAVLGAAAGCIIAAKAFRQLLLWSQINLLPPNIRKFKGEWALVTGGSEGVGKAVAAELAKHGLNVVLVSRSQAKLDAAATDISNKYSVQVRTFAADLTDRYSLISLQQYLTVSKTHISVLVANAGGAVSRLATYWDLTDEEETTIQNLNGQACYVLIKGLLPAMIKRGKGAVVAISSQSSRFGTYMAPYGAEKAKVNALCAALDSELYGSGVTVQAMVLGAVLTPGLTSFIAPSKAAAAAVTSTSAAAAAVAGVSAAGADTSVTPTSSSSTGSDLQSSSSSTAPAPTAAAAPVSLEPSISMPSAESVAAAIVKNIGKAGPVVTPYWGHRLTEWVMLDLLWPPALQRAALRMFSRQFKSDWEAQQAAAQA